MSNSTKTTVASLEARIIELETQVIRNMETATDLLNRITMLEATPARGARNYGPSSEASMTDEMAWRIRYGDLTGAKVKDIANDNGLSRGQVYSVRGNYTFTRVTADTFAFAESEDGEVKIVANK